MSIAREDFRRFVDRAMQDTSLRHMQPVIEKELLHYDILFCLEQGRLLDGLVFQGGTSLRLCRGGSRFSEDLDFAGGRDFSPSTLVEMKACIEDYVGSRYGLEVGVKEPPVRGEDPKHAELNIDKWQISIAVSPKRKDIPRQRIKVEVANVPAYTAEAVPLKVNYAFLPDGYGDMLIFAETLDEVMADKMVSLAATRKYVRYRDIWDLSWLKQQGAIVQGDLVRRKLGDYRLPGDAAMFDGLVARIPDLVAEAEFKNEMRRFLPSDVYDRTFGSGKFEGFLTGAVGGLFEELKREFDDGQSDPEFLL